MCHSLPSGLSPGHGAARLPRTHAPQRMACKLSSHDSYFSPDPDGWVVKT